MTITTTHAVGTFCWPELCSADASTSKSFYSSLFGWEPRDLHMPEGDYTVFTLGGQNVGAMYQMTEDRRQAGIHPHWNSYVAVADAEETARKCEALGGTVLMKPVDAGPDRMANLQDPEGVRFCIWQAGKEAEPMRINEVGALVWTELITRDADQASEFYSRLFGWRPQLYEGAGMPYTIFNLAGEDRGTGGMFEITEEMSGEQPRWLPYFMVEDADQIVRRTENWAAESCMAQWMFRLSDGSPPCWIPKARSSQF